MKIHFDSTTPIYLQIVAEFKRQLAAGELVSAGKVESVRELAQELGVNPNTVQRAFAELEREGLMYSERTSGRYITADVWKIDELRQSLAQELSERYFRQMTELGFKADQIHEILKSLGEDRNG